MVSHPPYALLPFLPWEDQGSLLTAAGLLSACSSTPPMLRNLVDKEMFSKNTAWFTQFKKPHPLNKPQKIPIDIFSCPFCTKADCTGIINKTTKIWNTYQENSEYQKLTADDPWQQRGVNLGTLFLQSLSRRYHNPGYYIFLHSKQLEMNFATLTTICNSLWQKVAVTYRILQT